MAEVRFQELDVGQGSANFLEIYDGTNVTVPTATMLFDLGTERDPKKKASDSTIDYICSKLKLMKYPTINLLVLSHSDSDHINLIAKLLGNFTPPLDPPTPGKPNLTIEKLYYAGIYKNYKKRNRENVIIEIRDFILSPSKDAINFTTGYSSFTTKASPFYTSNGVNILALVANIVIPTTSVDELPYTINTRSAVLLVTCGAKQFVVTGDATGRTIYEINTIIECVINNNIKYYNKYFSNVFMTTAPHHGSATTTFDIQGLGKSAPDPATNLQTFSDFIKTKCLTASAERVQRFGHPAWSVLKGLSGHLEKHAFVDTSYPLPSGGTRTLHPVTVHLNPGSFPGCPWPATTEKDFYSFDTELNLFTNLYCLGPNYYNVTIPPEPGATYNPSAASALPYASIAMGVSWEFKVDSAGKTAVSKRDDRPWIPPKAVHQLAAAGTGAFLAHPRSVSLAASLKPAFPSHAARLTGLRQLG